jgi:hypothetical protein
MTTPAAARVDIPTETAIPAVETDGHCPPIEAFVFPLHEEG